MKQSAFILLLFLNQIITSGQIINCSPAYFGPNANPVPETGNAKIQNETTISLSGNYYFGFGDQTKNLFIKAELPLLSGRISFDSWIAVLEHYHVTDEINVFRNMPAGVTSGTATGDIYFRTRISIFKEKKVFPAIIINSTFKTASGDSFGERRYYETPGYYFDVESGKSVYFKNDIISEIRFIVDLGFLCWQMMENDQNEGPMYCGKITLNNKLINFENSISGYHGWMHDGDNPLVYTSNLIIKCTSMNYFIQYQYGIRDYPYHHILLGLSTSISRLTPHYK